MIATSGKGDLHLREENLSFNSIDYLKTVNIYFSIQESVRIYKHIYTMIEWSLHLLFYVMK